MAGLLAAMLLLVLPAGLAGTLARRPGAAAVVDGVTVAAVALLVGGAIVPDAVRGAGWAVVVLFAGGLALPTVAERLGVRHDRVDTPSLVVAWLVLGLHAVLDGVALASAGPGPSALAVSIALHQVPVGLAVFGFQQGRLGTRGAVGALVALAGATAVGFAAGERILALADAGALALFQGFAAGFVLHVVGHAPLPGAGRHPGARLAGGALAVGAFLAARRAGFVVAEGGGAPVAEGLSLALAVISLAVVLLLRGAPEHAPRPA